MRFSGISNKRNGFTTAEIAPYVYFLRHGEGLRFFDFLKCMNTIFRKFKMTATVLQHLRLHKWFTFSALGDKRSAARDERIRRPGVSRG